MKIMKDAEKQRHNNHVIAGKMNWMKVKIQGKKELLDDWIRRLKSGSQEDAIFPLAGQDFRNKVIGFIEEEKRHLSIFQKKKSLIAVRRFGSEPHQN